MKLARPPAPSRLEYTRILWSWSSSYRQRLTMPATASISSALNSSGRVICK